LILSDEIHTGHICDVWINVDQRFDTLGIPSLNKFLPVWIVILVELPIPDKAITLVKMLFTDPVLHPKASNWNTKILEIVVFLLDDFFTTLESDHSSVHDPFRHWFHSANSLGNASRERLDRVTIL